MILWIFNRLNRGFRMKYKSWSLKSINFRLKKTGFYFREKQPIWIQRKSKSFTPKSWINFRFNTHRYSKTSPILRKIKCPSPNRWLSSNQSLIRPPKIYLRIKPKLEMPLKKLKKQERSNVMSQARSRARSSSRTSLSSKSKSSKRESLAFPNRSRESNQSSVPSRESNKSASSKMSLATKVSLSIISLATLSLLCLAST